MAHGIGQMFYYGDKPWHGLGEKLSSPANLDQALKAGGLDWEVELVPLAAMDDPEAVIPQRMAVVRKDREPGVPGRVIGVVHPDFIPLQNRAGAALFDSLLANGQALYHTGGYLKNGERVWLMAQLPQYQIQVGANDRVEPYLLFSNSHDGSQAIDIRLTTIRVVCQNTLSLALRNKDTSKFFRRSHNGRYDKLKIEADEFFAFLKKEVDETQKLFTGLDERQCADEAFGRFLEKLLPIPKQPVTAKTDASVRKAHESRVASIKAARQGIQNVREQGVPLSRMNRRNEELYVAECAGDFPAIPPDKKTWWGALNSVTAWVDHCQKIKTDRYAHIMFGSGDALKSKALGLVQEESKQEA